MARNTQVNTFITATATTAALANTGFTTALNTLIALQTGPINGLQGIAGLTPAGPRMLVGSDAQSGDYQYTAYAYVSYQTAS